jgi:RHS repeat-associated protein
MASTTYNYSVPGTIGVTDANGATTEYRFTDDGSLLQLTDPLNRVTSLTYDGNGNVSQITAPGNTISQFTYDGENRLLTQTNPLNQTVSYTYGENSDSPTVVTDAKGNPLTFTYDERGNVTEIGYIDGTSETYVYDQSGQVIQKTERSGDTFEYSYDQRGRLIQKAFDDGTFEEYTYDKRSNLTSIKDVNGGITSLIYNADNQVTQITYPDDRYLAYTYDAEGRRASIVDQNGFETNYSYDSQGRLTGLTDGTDATLVAYEYDAAGNLVKETNGNGTFTTYNYDLAGQLTGITNYASENVINSSFSYTYDASGKRIGEVNNDGSWTYSYDATGQLTQAQFDSTNPNIADQNLQYVYDGAKNRVQTIINGEITDYTANNLNQYSNVGNAEYTYDQDGNLIQVVDGSNTYKYTYNDENRIIQTETPNGVWQYEYDALGNRNAVIKDGVRTEYLIDPFSSFQSSDVVTELDNVVGQYNANGVLTANYAHGLGLVGRFGSNGAAYFDADAIGSVNGLTDNSGNYVNKYAYEPFGGILNSVEGINNPFQFVGELGVMNDSSGLNFMRARQYDPITGRFTATDPLGLNGGDENLYQYGLNDPLSFVDPNGEGWVRRLVKKLIEVAEEVTMFDPRAGRVVTVLRVVEKIVEIIEEYFVPDQTDPLVLDLDGDGVELISLEQSRTFFDTNSNGLREYTSWVSADDGLLVLDANNDGQINDISELFGDNSTNGFDDLATLDSNSDNVIDANDSQFNDLRIWIDRNEDGFTDAGELRTLAEWEIQSINLNRTDLEPGGSILSTGNFTFNDGSQNEIAAIALEVSLANTIYTQPVELKAETEFLPNLRGFGQLPNLNIAMSLDKDLLAQMRELVQLNDQNLEQVYGQVEDFLFKWAGVEDIDPNSRSEFFDARKQAFLEKFFQEPIDFEITQLGNTWGLRQSWADISNNFISLLAAQSFMRDIFSESSYNISSQSLETQASLGNLLEQIQNNLPEADTDAIRYWSYAIGVLDAHNDRFDLSQSEYDNTLKTALGSDLSEYLDALRNPILGREDKDVLDVNIPDREIFADGNLGDDTLRGGRQNDILSGGSGDDSLGGRDGMDLLIGGTGNDSLNGGAGNDTLNGGAGNDSLAGGIGDDVMIGGVGNDTYYIDNINDQVVEAVDEGTDTVRAGISWTLGANLENLVLTTSDAIDVTGNALRNSITGNSANNNLFGGDENDILKGNAGNDTLDGGTGNDSLDGGIGDDLMIGSVGNDIYYIDNINDQVVEAVDEGTDTVRAGISWTLGANLENLVLTTSDAIDVTGNALRNSITGNSANNNLFGGDENDILKGNAGNDTLDGGTGNDSLDGGIGDDLMIGSVGNDIYYIDNINDQVVEAVDEGTDTVRAGISWTLGANLENLVLTTSDAIDGTGNALRNVITGNTGNNNLFGGDENDTLNGGDGDDTLDGGNGNDTLTGGIGNDVLVGNSGNDRLTGGTGNDRFVYSSLNQGADTITDFSSIDDVLVLQTLFSNFNYMGTNPIADRYLQTVQAGANTLVQIDSDGVGRTAGFTTIFTLSNFNANDFSQSNLIL